MYLESSKTRAGARWYASVSAALSQLHRDDTEILVEEGIYLGHKVQTKSLEDLLRKYFNMK